MKQINELSNENRKNNVIDITQYFRVLKRRKWSIIVFIPIFVVIGILYLSETTPIYRAAAKIQADPTVPSASGQEQYLMNSMIFLYYETQHQIIQSRKVAETVIDRLDLVQDYKERHNNKTNNNSEESIFQMIKNKIYGVIGLGRDNDSLQLTDEQIKLMLGNMIQSNLNVKGENSSQIITISFENQDPILASKIANEISTAYIQFGLESRLSQIKDTSEWLTKQLEDLRITLQNSEERLRDFRLSQNLMNTEQQQGIANTKLQTLNTELVRAQTKLSEAKELFSQIKEIKANGGDYRAIGPVLQSSSIRELVKEEGALIRRVQELSERYGERHPTMIAARADLLTAKSNIQRETEKVVENIEKEYRSAQAQERNLQLLIKSTTESLQQYQGDSFQLTRLEREVENNRRVYESFLGKLLETDISGDYDATNIRVIDSATIPKIPIKPNKPLILTLCTILGALVGVVYALSREFMQEVFRTPDQLEEHLNLASLGITPLLKGQKGDGVAGLQYSRDQRSTFSEAINTIRTGVQFSNIDNPPQSILITSSTGSEGKTTLSTNLALAFSEIGKTVLIELDLRKPNIKKIFGREKCIFLGEILQSKNEINNLITTSDTDDLAIIACDSISENPTELIASIRFEEMIRELKKEFKYIIIDSPPTLPVTDSCMLAKFADATIVAVKAEDTNIKMARETVKRLEKVNAKLVGAVLTQASPEKMSYYGDHYYQNYYYGEPTRT